MAVMPMQVDEERRSLLAAEFRCVFGNEPSGWARAPGRVDLMGSHTDYNMGFVMTMTVDRDTWLAFRPRADGKVRVHSSNLGTGSEFSLTEIEHDPVNRWTDYVRGVVWAMQGQGHEPAGFNGLVQSTIPFGSGLSSSAALEMATAVALQALGDFKLEPVAMALMGQRAENQFVGVNCGILDQYSSALGRAGTALLLDCRSLSSRPVPVGPEVAVVIGDTCAERNLAGTEYGERRAQCEEGVRVLRQFYPDIRALRDVSCAQFEDHTRSLPPRVAKRCRFIIEENQRVLDMAEALPLGDGPAIGRLTGESWAGARDLFEIGSREMGLMMEAMLGAPGVIGARQAGAGFGGCMVAFVESGRTESFARYVEECYAVSSGILPAVYAVQAAEGAGLVPG
jgi:galactokinase